MMQTCRRMRVSVSMELKRFAAVRESTGSVPPHRPLAQSPLALDRDHDPALAVVRPRAPRALERKRRRCTRVTIRSSVEINPRARRPATRRRTPMARNRPTRTATTAATTLGTLSMTATKAAVDARAVVVATRSRSTSQRTLISVRRMRCLRMTSSAVMTTPCSTMARLVEVEVAAEVVVAAAEEAEVDAVETRSPSVVQAG